jgi:hypothetical protein
MTYTAQEESIEAGQPVELYLFTIGGAQYPYTNAEDEITKSSVTYTPEAISRTKIKNEASKVFSQLTVKMPVSNVFAKLFVGIPPGERARLKIRQFHRTDVAGELATIFDGLVSQVSFVQKGKVAKLIARPITSLGQNQVPKRTNQGLCNFNVYDSRCGLVESTWQETGTVTSVSGNDLTTSGLTNVGGGADYWEAGYVRFGEERRLIVAQSSNVLTLSLEFKENPDGESLIFVPGCKLRRADDCRTKFSNEINFGGFPYVPIKNPFESGIDYAT